MKPDGSDILGCHPSYDGELWACYVPQICYFSVCCLGCLVEGLDDLFLKKGFLDFVFIHWTVPLKISFLLQEIALRAHTDNHSDSDGAFKDTTAAQDNTGNTSINEPNRLSQQYQP